MDIDLKGMMLEILFEEKLILLSLRLKDRSTALRSWIHRM